MNVPSFCSQSCNFSNEETKQWQARYFCPGRTLFTHYHHKIHPFSSVDLSKKGKKTMSALLTNSISLLIQTYQPALNYCTIQDYTGLVNLTTHVRFLSYRKLICPFIFGNNVPVKLPLFIYLHTNLISLEVTSCQFLDQIMHCGS